MPNTLNADVDTGSKAAPSAVDGAGSSPNMDTDGAAKKLFFGKYETIEEAEKAHKEEQQLRGRQANELGELRKQVAELSEKTQLKEVLNNLVESNKAKNEPAKDWATFEEEMAELNRSDPGEYAKKSMKIQSAWLAEEAKKLKAEHAREIAEIQKANTELSEKYERLEPDYLENKAVVDKLVESGLSLKVAKKQAKDIAAMFMGDRTPPSGTLTATRKTASAPVNEYWKPGEREYLKSQGTTDDELKEMESDWKRRKGIA